MRRGVWLIWLCLALLPLRGMAHATMWIAGAPVGAPVAVSQTDAAAPCPMHAVNADAATAQAGIEAQHTGACQLCALCHSAALPMTVPACAGAAMPETAPVAAPSLGAGRLAPDGLFRPPR